MTYSLIKNNCHKVLSLKKSYKYTINIHINTNTIFVVTFLWYNLIMRSDMIMYICLWWDILWLFIYSCFHFNCYTHQYTYTHNDTHLMIHTKTQTHKDTHLQGHKHTHTQRRTCTKTYTVKKKHKDTYKDTHKDLQTMIHKNTNKNIITSTVWNTDDNTTNATSSTKPFYCYAKTICFKRRRPGFKSQFLIAQKKSTVLIFVKLAQNLNNL